MNDQEFIDAMRPFVPMIMEQEQKEKQIKRDYNEVMKYEIERSKQRVGGYLRIGKRK